jgi:hypothetical protein
METMNSNTLFTVFNRSVSRKFGKIQCGNAAEKYGLSCFVNTFSSSDESDFEYFINGEISATVCKKICIVTCAFKYAALYS